MNKSKIEKYSQDGGVVFQDVESKHETRSRCVHGMISLSFNVCLNFISFKDLLIAYGQLKQGNRVVAMLEKMLSDCKPDVIAYNAAVSSLARCGLYKEANGTIISE